MMDEDKLREAIEPVWIPVYAASYEQVRDVLKDTHGERGWIGALAQSITGSAKRSGKEYLAARRSIERHEKQGTALKAYGGKVSDVGRQLAPIGKRLPDNKITVRVDGEQSNGKQGTRDRQWSVTFTGADAYAFADKPSFRDIFKRLGYPDHVIDLLEDGEYELDVSYVMAA